MGVFFVLACIGCVMVLVRLWSHVQRAFLMCEACVLMSAERWILARSDMQRLFGVATLLRKCRYRVLTVVEGLIDAAPPVDTVLSLHRVRESDGDEGTRKAA